MMRYVLIILLLIPPVGLVSLDKPYFKIVQQSITKKSAGQYTATVIIESSNAEPYLFESSQVPITSERYILYGTYPDQIISENNTLFGMIDVDFNGDGDVKDSYRVAKRGDAIYMNNEPLNIIMGKMKVGNLTVFKYTGSGNELLVNSLSESGKKFIVYTADYPSRKMIIGFNLDNAIPLEKFSNPCVQIMLCKIMPARDASPGFSISSEKNFTSFTNEQIFEDQGGDWVGIKWIVKPVTLTSKRTEITVNLSGITPPFALLSHINYSPGDGIRFRGVTSKSLIQ